MAKQEIKKIKTDSGIPVKRIFSSKDLVDKTSQNEEAGRYRSNLFHRHRRNWNECTGPLFSVSWQESERIRQNRNGTH